MPEHVPVTFLYSLGQHVRWAERTDLSWTIASRQYHEETGRRYVTYGIVLTTARPEDRAVTAYEADLEPVDANVE